MPLRSWLQSVLIQLHNMRLMRLKNSRERHMTSCSVTITYIYIYIPRVLKLVVRSIACQKSASDVIAAVTVMTDH